MQAAAAATNSTRSRIAILAAGVLVAANGGVPVLWGDVYPFTSAPMFRDAPTECCQYTVRSLDQQGLEQASWLLQRVYDGNPVGYGVGIQAPRVLEQRYGEVHDQASIQQHVSRQFSHPANAAHPAVEIEQTVLGAQADGSVGPLRTERYVIERHVIEPGKVEQQ